MFWVLILKINQRYSLPLFLTPSVTAIQKGVSREEILYRRCDYENTKLRREEKRFYSTETVNILYVFALVGNYK